jgi:hypothetical protein
MSTSTFITQEYHSSQLHNPLYVCIVTRLTDYHNFQEQTEGYKKREKNTTINDLRVRTRQGTVRSHSAAAGAVVAGVVGSA